MNSLQPGTPGFRSAWSTKLFPIYQHSNYASLCGQGQLGGKLLIFQNSLPSLGVGRLRLRGDDIRVYGTDKEHTLRVPEDPFYKQMAADLTKFQIAVNVYAFSDKYTDIASLGTLLCAFTLFLVLMPSFMYN